MVTTLRDDSLIVSFEPYLGDTHPPWVTLLLSIFFFFFLFLSLLSLSQYWLPGDTQGVTLYRS